VKALLKVATTPLKDVPVADPWPGFCRSGGYRFSGYRHGPERIYWWSGMTSSNSAALIVHV